MSILPLIPENDVILRTPCQEFDFDNPPTEPNQLAIDLAETMISKNGLGLAAPQVGIPYRVFAMTGNPIKVCFNPRIVDQTSDEVLLEEGCLSYPGLVCKVKRPSMVKIRYTMPNGETVTERFIGMTARVILHEMDHLDGILFFNRASLYHREQAFRKRKANK
jgi:peptide deformylase